MRHLFYNTAKYLLPIISPTPEDRMKKEDLIEFEKEEINKLDKDQALSRFNELYRAMKDANNLKCFADQQTKFDLNFLFADVLECLNLLSFNNLSKVIGIVQAGKIWSDVKTSRE